MAIDYLYKASSTVQMVIHDTEFARDVYNGLRAPQKSSRPSIFMTK